MQVSVLISLIFMTCLLPVAYCADEQTSDMAILSKVLQNSSANGYFTVVDPKTTLSKLEREDRNELAQTKKYVQEKLKFQNKDIDKLLEILIHKNKKQVKLTLKSVLKDGYLIDFDGKFKKYFIDHGGGWGRWYKENPKASGWTSVSLPAYDPQTGLVLVYKATQSHWLAGAGYLIMYKYVDGKLEELGRVMLWLS